MYHLLLYFVYCSMKKCFKCNTIKPIKDFHKNKCKKDGLSTQCKSCKKKTNRRWLENNRQKRRDYRAKKRIEDPMFKVKENLRSRCWIAFNNISIKKSKKTSELLGTDYETFKMHMESQFKDNMSWDNYGEWHIDHIIPLASANTEEELIKLFHYTNTQPLWAEENLRKGSSINFSYTNNNNHK